MKKSLIFCVILMFCSTVALWGQTDTKVTTPKKETTVEKLRKIATIHFGITLPTWGGGWMGTVAGAPRILKYSQYKAEYGSVSTFGYGVGADVKLGEKGFYATFDIENTSYMQEVFNEGKTFRYTNPDDGDVYDVTLPLGLKYTTATVGFRPGVKYVYSKFDKFHPWLSVIYGLYLWNVKYVSWDKDKIYGKDNGASTRFSWALGVDFPLAGMTITPYIDANAPIANYSMPALFGYGDYNRFDGHLYPGLRLGLRVGGF